MRVRLIAASTAAAVVVVLEAAIPEVAEVTSRLSFGMEMLAFLFGYEIGRGREEAAHARLVSQREKPSVVPLPPAIRAEGTVVSRARISSESHIVFA
jgi:hypothetical protein